MLLKLISHPVTFYDPSYGMANRAILSFWYLIIFGIDKQEYRLLLVIAVFMALERQILIILEVGELGTSSGAVVIKEEGK